MRAGSPRLLSVQTLRAVRGPRRPVRGRLPAVHEPPQRRVPARRTASRSSRSCGALADLGFPVGGTNNAISNIVHTQGWVHCHSSATDASGIVKAVMDVLYDRFTHEDLPAKLRIALACCLNMCGAVHCSDIAILGVHRRRAEDQPRDAAENVRSADAHRVVPDRRHPAGHGRRARPPWRSSRSSACSAATATRCARRCRSTTPRTTGSRSGWAAR